VPEKDRVSQILEHERAAAGDDIGYSRHKWEAARLIWQDVQEGKSRHALAEEISRSHTYVNWMVKCWELMRKRGISDSIDRLPLFSEVYYSTEIRGESAGRARQPRPDQEDTGRDRGERDDADNRHTERPADWVAGILAYAEKLEEHTATWPLISHDDVIALRGIPKRIRAIIEGITNAKRA
jgi:hypothetical protein